MKAGILSDSHDCRESVDRALELFFEERVGAILHLGDVCAGFTLWGVRGCGIPLVGVFGNNDGDRRGIQVVSEGAFFRGPHTTELSGRRIVMAHCFDELQADLSRDGRFDLVLFGHTHRPLTMKARGALVVNPGEACGYLSGRATCAIVDLDRLEARIVDIPARRGG